MTYRFEALLTKIPIAFFMETGKKKILKSLREPQKSLKGKATLNKKANPGDPTLSDFQVYYKAPVIKPEAAGT